VCLGNHILTERRLFAFKNKELFRHEFGNATNLIAGTA